jgi:hypothetical protein
MTRLKPEVALQSPLVEQDTGYKNLNGRIALGGGGVTVTTQLQAANTTHYAARGE